MICEILSAAELIYRWGLLHLMVQQEPYSPKMWKAILFCNMEVHVYPFFPIIVWSTGYLDKHGNDAAIKSPLVKQRSPDKWGVCHRHGEVTTQLLFPKVLCSEGSRVSLRSLGSATIYPSDLGVSGWRETCPTLSMQQPHCVWHIIYYPWKKYRPSSLPWLRLG